MDLMVDLETFGTGPKAVIASIGAVLFDYKAPPIFGELDNKTLEEKGYATFYRIIDTRSQPGREWSAETMYFWMNQPDAARKALLPNFNEDNRAHARNAYENLVPLGKALSDLTTFCKQNKVEKMWCYGATFDHVILMDAYKDMRQVFPVSYRDLLDMRTFVYVMPKVERPTFGTSHNALDDAINQAIWMQKIWAVTQDRFGKDGIDSLGLGGTFGRTVDLRIPGYPE